MYKLLIKKETGLVILEDKIFLEKKISFSNFFEKIKGIDLFLNQKNEDNINFRIDVNFLETDFALMGEFDSNKFLSLLYLVKLNSIIVEKKWDTTEQDVLQELEELSILFKNYFFAKVIKFNGINEYLIELEWGRIILSMTKDLYHSIVIQYK
ncbi:hypothetical protein ACG94X_15280 [Acinetobacter sp. ULE_I010]|uniref:hypothetical protein n=1 Tax=Acinetobacter sp. ULE_I010 TaxID=3373065 RepID=UPI003AF9C3AB